MRSSNSVEITDPQSIKIAGGDVFPHAIDLIDHQMKRLLFLAKRLDQSLIPRMKAFPSVHHQQDHVGFVDSHHRLPGHCRVDTEFIARNTAGVDHDIGDVTQLAIAVLSIPGQARKVCHQSIP